MQKLVIGALLVSAAAARAEPVLAAAQPENYVEAGVMFGAAEPVIGWNTMATISGGHRIWGPLWVDAAVGYGPTVDNLGGHAPNGGSNGLVRGGVEARWCSGPHEILCAIAGADLGVQHGSWTPSDDLVQTASSTAFVAIPRVGFDVGGARIRVRIELDADTAVVDKVTARDDTGAQMTSSPTGVIGIELAAGVAYQW